MTRLSRNGRAGERNSGWSPSAVHIQRTSRQACWWKKRLIVKGHVRLTDVCHQSWGKQQPRLGAFSLWRTDIYGRKWYRAREIPRLGERSWGITAHILLNWSSKCQFHPSCIKSCQIQDSRVSSRETVSSRCRTQSQAIQEQFSRKTRATSILSRPWSAAQFFTLIDRLSLQCLIYSKSFVVAFEFELSCQLQIRPASLPSPVQNLLSWIGFKVKWTVNPCMWECLLDLHLVLCCPITQMARSESGKKCVKQQKKKEKKEVENGS